MPPSTSLRHRCAAALLIGGLALAPANLVGAETPADPVIEEEALGELVALVLAELGLPADAAGPIVDDLLAGVADRLNELVEQGIVDPERVDTLADVVEEGGFDDVVPTVVEETRERRDAFRDAAESVLADLGVEVPDEGSLKDAIEAAGLTREALAELLEDSGIELPAPPARPDVNDCADGGDGCPSPRPQPPSRPAAPTTTQPPPPPAEEPAPTPAPAYPEVAPEPAPEYPTRGGQDAPSEPEPPAPRPDYPTAGQGGPDTAGDEDAL
ncbi:MAG: hypothetical protein AAGA90_03480 [Actinomycetota bacterium]